MTSSLTSPVLSATSPTTSHETVFLKEAVDALALTPASVVVDATLGGAGHFREIYQRLGTEGTLIGIDADEDALARARAFLAKEVSGPTTHLFCGNFRELDTFLDTVSLGNIDAILFDLGWSAFHLSRGRGFSFQKDEPLVMTYGEPDGKTTAADLLNVASEEALSDMLFSLGEERFARSIARGIVEARREKPIKTTQELVAIVEASTPAWYHHRRINPATKTFQALRIAVNDELGAVRDGIATALERLSEGGRIAVITFHSIEDRVVKHVFREAAYEGKGTQVTKKPIVPSGTLLAENPRARSAKLRVFEKHLVPAV